MSQISFVINRNRRYLASPIFLSKPNFFAAYVRESKEFSRRANVTKHVINHRLIADSEFFPLEQAVHFSVTQFLLYQLLQVCHNGTVTAKI